jgi:2-polyprenyl-6-hydroxyphenyl methylase/3-demethylubiquinone-9 3-methyltransferase
MARFGESKAGKGWVRGRGGGMVEAASIDPGEAAKFARLADTWWDPSGPMRPLHRLNPTRLRFVRDRVCAHFGRDMLASRPLDGLGVIDIGCGGGLIAEPLARMGARVTGIDAAVENIEVALRHSAVSGLSIDYRAASAEELAAAGVRYDVVLALEVVEHVADVASFLSAVAMLVRPGGIAVLATLNRTAKSFALAIVGAEYVLNWLPRGTHDWNRFMRPSELTAHLRREGLAVVGLKGLTYAPFTDEWRECDDLGVNYMALAVKP